MDKNVLILAAITFFCGCERVIEFEKKNDPKALVIRAVVEESQAIAAEVSSIQPLESRNFGFFGDTTNSFVPKGARLIVTNGTLSDTLLYNNEQKEVGVVGWKSTDQLSLSLEHPDYTTLRSQAFFYPKPQLEILNQELDSNGYFEFLKVKLRVAGFENVNTPHLRIQIKSVGDFSYESISGNDPRFFTNGSSDILGEDQHEVRYFGPVAFLSDYSNRDNIEFDVYASEFEQDSIELSVSFLSPDAYAFETSLINQAYSSGDFFNSTVPIISSIKEGIGVFYTLNSENVFVEKKP